MSKEYIVVCTCGEVISDDDIYYSNRCNEEGEEYYVVEADCPKCKKSYECNSWGECEDKNEAKEELVNNTDLSTK